MVRVLDSQGERSQKKEPAFQGKTEREEGQEEVWRDRVG